MIQSGRILLLAVAIVLLVVGVVFLKRQVGDTNAPPVAIPGDVLPAAREPHRVDKLPTILPTDPNSEIGPATHSPWRDSTPIPLNDLDTSTSPTFPVNNLLPPPTDSTLHLPGNATSLQDSRSLKHDSEAAGEAAGTDSAFRERADTPQSLAIRDVPAVSDVSTGQVVTQHDESLWHIAERVYGDGLFYKALFRHNRDRIERPDRIVAGTELLTPPVEQLRQLYPTLCPASVPGKL